MKAIGKTIKDMVEGLNVSAMAIYTTDSINKVK